MSHCGRSACVLGDVVNVGTSPHDALSTRCAIPGVPAWCRFDSSTKVGIEAGLAPWDTFDAIAGAPEAL